MKIDLHCHTNLSDGALAPEDLVHYAGALGIDMLAITDHDRAEEMPHLSSLAQSLSIQLIAGIELSSQWRNIGIHIVGLGVALDSEALDQTVKKQTQTRELRAKEIGLRLTKLNIEDSYAKAKVIAGQSQIGRPHFAQYLVESGQVKDLKTAYKKYLGAGKAGDVKCFWPEMAEVVEWIHRAKGYAVLAHPAKYNLTRRKLDFLCQEFYEAGGDGLEVVSGMQTKDITDYHGELCHRYALYASCGSDFHGPVSSWHDLGKMSPMPSSCRPIWELWQ